MYVHSLHDGMMGNTRKVASQTTKSETLRDVFFRSVRKVTKIVGKKILNIPSGVSQLAGNIGSKAETIDPK